MDKYFFYDHFRNWMDFNNVRDLDVYRKFNQISELKCPIGLDSDSVTSFQTVYNGLRITIKQKLQTRKSRETKI